MGSDLDQLRAIIDIVSNLKKPLTRPRFAPLSAADPGSSPGQDLSPSER
jgi:hypothetical protein